MTARLDAPDGLRVLGPLGEGATADGRAAILSRPALDLVAELARTFRPRIQDLLAARAARHERLARGEQLDFLAETRAVREGDWRCAPLPADLLDRRVEITGPVDRKMIINALNSGASVFMADFEDANAPTWANCIDGQVNLRDAVQRTISFEGGGKKYALAAKTAVLFVRPRGFHLTEAHVEVDGAPVPAMLFDFGLYFFHNARALLDRGSGPYFYLPKMESHLEARLWNDVFLRAQERLGIPAGTIKATCLVETLPGAFEMDEILHELRAHSAGLNCGRWDYIFSYIKVNGTDASRVLPDRAQVGMTQPFMQAYTRMVIKTCHRRGVHAMGGMAAQIPVKGDEAANERAFAKVRADKLREVEDGHDGTWVAHPALVAVAKSIFDEHMKGANQIESGKQSTWTTSAADLLRAPDGTRTEEGLRHNVRVGIQYIEAWLRGSGAVPLYDLMEDAATAEISRTQIWQWLEHGVALEDGRRVTRELLDEIVRSETKTIEREIGAERFASGLFDEATKIFVRVSTESPLIEFLTLPAYEALRRLERSREERPQ
jgi:malate synthase